MGLKSGGAHAGVQANRFVMRVGDCDVLLADIVSDLRRWVHCFFFLSFFVKKISLKKVFTKLGFHWLILCLTSADGRG